MAAERKVLTINRRRWRRYGYGTGPTQLLNPDGFMCCLGFDALARGITPNQILRVDVPDDVHDPPDSYKQIRNNFEAIQDAVAANDGSYASDAMREAAVRAALLRLGWDEVVFVNGKPHKRTA